MTTSDFALFPLPSTNGVVSDPATSTPAITQATLHAAAGAPLVEPGAVPAESMPPEAAAEEEWKAKLKSYGFVSALVVDDAFAPVAEDEVGGKQKAAFKEYIEDNGPARDKLYSLLGIEVPQQDPEWEPDWEQDVFTKISFLWTHSQTIEDELKDALQHLFDAVLTDRLPKREQVVQVINVLTECGFDVITSHTFDAGDATHLAADILFVDLYVDRKIKDGDTGAAVKASAPIVKAFLDKSTGLAGGTWRTEKCLPPVFVISSHNDVLDITTKMVEAGIKRSCLRSMHKSDAELELKAAIKLIETYAPLALTWQTFKHKMNKALQDKAKEAVEQLDDLDVREVALLYKATIEPSNEDFEPYIGWLWGESISAKLYEAGIEAAKSINFPADLPIAIDGKADVQDTFVQLYEESSVVYQGLSNVTAEGKYAAQVSFGDLFIPTVQNDGRPLLTIYAVMSRACDVVRAECDMNILCRLTDAKKIEEKRDIGVGQNLLEGLTRSITVGAAKYLINFGKDTAVQTVPFGDLNNRDKYVRIGRFSPLQALQLQQLLLADFGRVGTPSALGFLGAFDAQIRVIHNGNRIATFDTPARQFYSAIAYKYRDRKGDALKVTFTGGFVAFLRDSLAGMQKEHGDAFKLIQPALTAINSAPTNKRLFEIDINKDVGKVSYTLISESRLKVYVVGEPKENEASAPANNPPQAAVVAPTAGGEVQPAPEMAPAPVQQAQAAAAAQDGGQGSAAAAVQPAAKVKATLEIAILLTPQAKITVSGA